MNINALNLANRAVRLTGAFDRPVMVQADVALPQGPTGAETAAPTRGFGIDLDGDGRIGANDGVIAFKNEKGEFDIEDSNRVLKSFAGDFDFDGDGSVSEAEKKQGGDLKARGDKLDLDKDGVLANWEMQKAGAEVLKVSVGEDGKVKQEVMDSEKLHEQFELQRQMSEFQMAQQMMSAAYFRNFMFMQQGVMMGMGGMSGGFGTYNGYPMGLTMPIY